MKLHRPYIPIPVRIKVAQRQLAEYRHDVPILDQWSGETDAAYLDYLLARLSVCLAGILSRLQLDHDPALTNRKFNPHTKKYTPDANDERFLTYRTKPAHDIKTRVRGDGAQLSDLALRRKFKRIDKREREGKR